MHINKKCFEKVVELAFKEDYAERGDITSDALFLDETDSFFLISKDNGVLCGTDIFAHVFKRLDSECAIKFFKFDGDILKKGDKIAWLNGKIKTILMGERVAINFISHLSGIATKTKQFAEKTNGKTKILDTRKTLPAYRMMEKYAVICGGGENHRLGLYDMIMIKDNHIDNVGSITNAVNAVRKKWGDRFKIEVETRTLDEVEEALKSKVDRIMLDNMSLAKIKKAVSVINKRAEIEVSGNMTLAKITKVSETGVDFISVGALTHSVKAFDFSLKSNKEYYAKKK